MRAGNLRHFVTLQAPSTTKGSDFSDPQPTWSTFATVPASIEPLRGREYMANLEEQAALDVRIRIRWMEGVTESLRVLHGSTVYEIASVINVNGRARELELMCRVRR